MSHSINITRRERKRRLKDGTTTVQLRYVVNYIDPETLKRAQKFFEKRRDAETFKQSIIVDIQSGDFFSKRDEVTVGDVVALWFDAREGKLKPNSIRNHLSIRPLILGPLLCGATPRQRADHTMHGVLPEGTKLVQLLSAVKIRDLSTADIRKWYMLLEKEVGVYSAKRAKLMLKSALELGAEDYSYRPPAMPKIIKSGTKVKKTLLTPDDIAQLIDHAEGDPMRGIYYAFPFLAGTRPSEQLPLLWEDIDFETNHIRIHRSQDQKGQIYETTKTEAGTRDIPMSPRLRSMLLQHRLTCARKDGSFIWCSRVLANNSLGHARVRAAADSSSTKTGASAFGKQGSKRRAFLTSRRTRPAMLLCPISKRKAWKWGSWRKLSVTPTLK